MKANTRLQSGMFDQKFLLCLKVSFYESCNSKNKKISHLACGVDPDGNNTFSTCKLTPKRENRKFESRYPFKMLDSNNSELETH